MDQAIDETSRRQHGVFSERQARRAGYSRSAIRHRRTRGLWLPAAPRVLRSHGAPTTDRSQLMAAVLSVGDDCVVSHESAAALLGLPGFAALPPEVTVLRRPPRIPSVVVHQTFSLPPHHWTTIDGIPTATAARVLFDLAGCLDSRRVARLLDLALGRRLVQFRAVERVFMDLAEQGRDGTAVMRKLLDARRDDYTAPESELEARFLELRAHSGLPEPAAQVDLGDDDGWIGRVDFLWRQQRLVVELDGAAHHTAYLDREADKARDERLTNAGWRVERFTWGDVVDRPNETVRALRALLDL